MECDGAVLNEELIDAVYRAALDPAAWQGVMPLLRQRFPSNAQTFYLLHRATRRVQPLYLEGVQPRWVGCFDELYFAADNPWMRVSQALHRPGIVRTTERLEAHLRDEGVLYRSAYYHEWMRPQRFRHNLGNTLLAEDGLIANITLFRPPDMPAFDSGEVRAFESLSSHMTRALRMSLQLERSESCPAGTAAFDALPQALALLDERRRVLYANASMETLLRAQRGLRVRHGELTATDSTAQQRLADYLAGVLGRDNGAQHKAGPPDALLRVGAGGAFLSVRAIPVHGRITRHLPSRRTLLLMVGECAGAARAMTPAALEQLHGCTPREARLAQLLAEGSNLRGAAEAMGITYGSARTYLKIVFHKIGVRSQAQLVGKLLSDGPFTKPRPALH